MDDEFIYDTEYPMDDGFMYNTEFPMEGGAADGLYREVTDINENDIDGMVPAGMDDDAEVAE